MADKKYAEISDNIERKVSQFVDTFLEEELEHALDSLNAPSDIRQLLVDKIAEKMVIIEGTRLEPYSLVLTEDLDKLLIVALSPARIKKLAAQKILTSRGNDRHLSNLLRFSISADLDPEIAREVEKITDERLLGRTKFVPSVAQINQECSR